MADLLDKVKHGVDRGILTISVKSREMFDTVKVKNRIGDIKRKRRNALEDLGNSVYRMFRNNKSFDQDRVQEKCETIAGLDGQIEEHNEQLRLIRLRAEESLGGQKALQKPKTEHANDDPLARSVIGGAKSQEPDDKKTG